MKLSLHMVGWNAEQAIAARNTDEAIAEHHDALDPWFHRQYLEVVHELSAIRLWKVQSYGTERYTIANIDTNAWLCYTDCRRKSVRLEQLTRAVARGDAGDLERLVETYADLANYAIMAVQILGAHLEQTSVLARRSSRHGQAPSGHEQTSEPSK